MAFSLFRDPLQSVSESVTALEFTPAAALHYISVIWKTDGNARGYTHVADGQADDEEERAENTGDHTWTTSFLLLNNTNGHQTDVHSIQFVLI